MPKDLLRHDLRDIASARPGCRAGETIDMPLSKGFLGTGTNTGEVGYREDEVMFSMLAILPVWVFRVGYLPTLGVCAFG